MSLLSEGLSQCDAYVLGLMHDVGRLLLDLVPASVAASRDRLVQNGCEISIAELLTCGIDHAEAGALVLRHWGLPDAYIEAIRFHHQPQATDSNLAALLYLVEFWTESREDPASNVRLRAALNRLDLDITEILRMRTKKSVVT
jgi:HD-like signal output (HDOD) protein